MSPEDARKRAEEILGGPLPPRDSPEYLKAIAKISEKDPVLAKALIASRPRPKEEEKEASQIRKKVETEVKQAERRAQLRERLKALQERIFTFRASVAGAETKVPRKPVLLILGGLVVVAALYFVWSTLGAQPRQAQAVNLPIAQANQVPSETTKKAEEVLGRELPTDTKERIEALKELAAKDPALGAEVALGSPLAEPGTPEYEKQLERLRQIDPALARAVEEGIRQKRDAEEAKKAVQALVGEASQTQVGVPETEIPTAAQGEAVPPPPEPVTPPAAPPPPTASGGSAMQEPNVLAERTTPGPVIQESPSPGQGQAQGQGGGASGGGPSANRLRPVGFFLAEVSREGAAQASGTTTEARTKERGFLLIEGAKTTAGAPTVSPGPGPGMGEVPFQGGGVLAEREAPKFLLADSGRENLPKGFTVLAEAPQTGVPRTDASPSVQSTPSSPPSPSQDAWTGESGSPGANLFPAPQASTNAFTGQAQPGSGTPTTPPLPQGVEESPALPYAPGSFLVARLQVQIAVVEGGTSPIVLEGADGSIWVGTARLNALGRVEAELDTLYLRGKAYKVRALVYDEDRQLGIKAQVEEKAPSLAQDILRASASALGQYVDLLSKQTTTIQLPGGGVAQSQQAPSLEMVVLGSIGRLFSLPEDRKSLVRVAQVSPGKVVQVMVLGG